MHILKYLYIFIYIYTYTLHIYIYLYIFIPICTGSIEMEDMIAYNMQEYEDKAVELGLNHQKRLHVRSRLAAKRLEAPLFDTGV